MQIILSVIFLHYRFYIELTLNARESEEIFRCYCMSSTEINSSISFKQEKDDRCPVEVFTSRLYDTGFISH